MYSKSVASLGKRLLKFINFVEIIYYKYALDATIYLEKSIQLIIVQFCSVCWRISMILIFLIDLVIELYNFSSRVLH